MNSDILDGPERALSQETKKDVPMAIKTADRCIADAISDTIEAYSKGKLPPDSHLDDELEQAVNDAIDAYNVSAPKSRRHPNQQGLKPSHVALAMSLLYDVRLVTTAPEVSDADNALLAVYEAEGDKRGLYNTNENELLAKAARIAPVPNERYAKDLLFCLRLSSELVSVSTDRDLVPVNNGVFDYRTKELLPFSPDMVFLAKSHVDYDPAAANVPITNPDDGTVWDVESWLADIAMDDEIADLMWELISATLRPNVSWGKAAWLYSTKGANGKGTFCDLVRNVCGQGTYCSIPVADFSKQFAMEELLTASSIIVDENDNGSYLETAGNLKAVITNDVIRVDRKHKKAIKHRFRGFMIQCFNEYPKFRDRSGSLYRRQLIVPFEKTFVGCERKYIKYDYINRKGVLEYVLKRALESDFYELSTPELCKQALDGFMLQNDPILEFFTDVFPRLTWDMIPFKIAFDMYKNWLADNTPGGKPIGFQRFRTELIDIVNASDEWVYTGSRYDTRLYMPGPEPLLDEFKVEKFLNRSARGASNPSARCTPQNLVDRYVAPIRISALQRGGGGDDDDE